MIKSTIYPLLVRVVLALTPVVAHASCDDGQLQIKGSWGVARFAVEIADTPDLRRKGLQNRSNLPLSSGMLFIYDQPAPASFWMKDTLIPLDILFIDEEGRIRHIHPNAVPFSEEFIVHDGDVAAVLEINGGLTDLYGMNVDSVIMHARLNQGIAAWPCDK